MDKYVKQREMVKDMTLGHWGKKEGFCVYTKPSMTPPTSQAEIVKRPAQLHNSPKVKEFKLQE